MVNMPPPFIPAAEAAVEAAYPDNAPAPSNVVAHDRILDELKADFPRAAAYFESGLQWVRIILDAEPGESARIQIDVERRDGRVVSRRTVAHQA